MANDVSLLRSVLNRSNIKQSDPALYQALFRVIDYLAGIPSEAIIAPGANGQFIFNKDGSLAATPNMRIEPQHGHIIIDTALFSKVGLGLGDWTTRDAFLFQKSGTSTLTALRVISINMPDANVNLDMQWQNYTPDWTSTGVAPDIGNGVKDGAYCRIGRLVFFRVRLIFGTTTNFGNGTYRFSLPVTAFPLGDTVTVAISEGMFYDSSTALRYYVGGYLISNSLFEPVHFASGTPGQLTRFNVTSPVTLAAGDQLAMMGYYRSEA